MLRVVMYGPDKSENRHIRELLEDILWAAEIKPVFKEFTDDRDTFFTYVRHNPYLVMLVVQTGPEGVETVRLAKRANPSACLVWFSDQDYALLAFELRLTFFGLLQKKKKKVASALSACYYTNSYPSWSNVLSLAQSTPFSQCQTGEEDNKKTPLNRR